MRAEHEIEGTRLSQILRSAIRTFAIYKLVGSQARLALPTIKQRSRKSLFMSRVLPNQAIQNDRRIEPFNIIAFVNHPAPPGLLHVVVKLYAHRAVIPRAAKAAINFRRWINEAATLRERDNSFNVGCRHGLVVLTY